jgi:hypothetical protein
MRDATVVFGGLSSTPMTSPSMRLEMAVHMSLVSEGGWTPLPAFGSSTSAGVGELSIRLSFRLSSEPFGLWLSCHKPR